MLIIHILYNHWYMINIQNSMHEKQTPSRNNAHTLVIHNNVTTCLVGGYIIEIDLMKIKNEFI